MLATVPWFSRGGSGVGRCIFPPPNTQGRAALRSSSTPLGWPSLPRAPARWHGTLPLRASDSTGPPCPKCRSPLEHRHTAMSLVRETRCLPAVCIQRADLGSWIVTPQIRRPVPQKCPQKTETPRLRARRVVFPYLRTSTREQRNPEGAAGNRDES